MKIRGAGPSSLILEAPRPRVDECFDAPNYPSDQARSSEAAATIPEEAAIDIVSG
jgi:hypothetical protein